MDWSLLVGNDDKNLDEWGFIWVWIWEELGGVISMIKIQNILYKIVKELIKILKIRSSKYVRLEIYEAQYILYLLLP